VVFICLLICYRDTDYGESEWEEGRECIGGGCSNDAIAR
jgi:hypothetical protein